MQVRDRNHAGASIASTASELLSQAASMAEVVAGHQRRTQEWQLQETLAQYEVNQLTQQIAGANARLAAARQELEINRQEIANATQVEALTRTRFTNQELYAWMVGRIATVYFQAFRL